LQCTKEACGWSVRAEFEMTHEMSPSGIANPTVKLALADTALRREAMKHGSDQLELLPSQGLETAQ
jgi:hypothetical protein